MSDCGRRRGLADTGHVLALPTRTCRPRFPKADTGLTGERSLKVAELQHDRLYLTTMFQKSGEENLRTP